jgi:hypothetical protein
MSVARWSLVVALQFALAFTARAQSNLPDASQPKQQTDTPANVVILAAKQSISSTQQATSSAQQAAIQSDKAGSREGLEQAEANSKGAAIAAPAALPSPPR